MKTANVVKGKGWKKFDNYNFHLVVEKNMLTKTMQKAPARFKNMIIGLLI